MKYQILIALCASLISASAPMALADEPAIQAIPQVVPTNIISGLESGILKYTNLHRIEIGVPVLKELPGATQMALTFSQEMAASGHFSHDSADGTTYNERIKKTALCSGGCPEITENILRIEYSSLPSLLSQVSTEEDIDSFAKIIVRDWLASPDHKRNLEDPLVEEIGSGVAFSPDGKFFATQEFLRRTPLTLEEVLTLSGVFLPEVPVAPVAPPIVSTTPSENPK